MRPKNLDYEEHDLSKDGGHLFELWEIWDKTFGEGTESASDLQHTRIEVLLGSAVKELGYADRMCVREAVICEEVWGLS